MSIITIARETGAWGKRTATRLAKIWPATLVNKDLLEQNFAVFGKDGSWLEKYDEKRPGLLSLFSSSQELYFMLMKLAILQEISSHDQSVILGRGAHLMLKNVPNCLKVRLVAPLDVRCQRVCEATKCSEKDALQFINTNDSHRAGFCNFHYDSNWNDMNSYDLTLNTANLAEEDVPLLILDAVSRIITPEKEAAGKTMLQNMLLAQAVKSHIIFDCKIQISILDVLVNTPGQVTLVGATPSVAIANAAAEAAKECNGVVSVDNQIKVSLNSALPTIPR